MFLQRNFVYSTATEKKSIMNLTQLLTASLMSTLAFSAPRLGAEGYSDSSPVPAEALAKIEAAMPAQPRVSPQRPRKLLVYSFPESYHSSVPYGARALVAMARKSRAFEAVLTTNTASFEPENLKQFDAIFLNNITPIIKLPKELFLPGCGENFDKVSASEQGPARQRNERLKRSVMDFVRGGKGLCGNHSTTDCFYEWREFGQMLGGYFDGHPWHEKVTLELVDPQNPVNAAFEGRSFQVTDEIYQFKAPYTRDALHVLTRLDITKVNMSRPGVNRPDKDFAVSWVRDWGKGRVFYCSLGHREEIYFNPVVMQHYLDGIQFALGDLKADARPSAQEK
jgi:type 1 glutamine amidotransferase